MARVRVAQLPDLTKVKDVAMDAGARGIAAGCHVFQREAVFIIHAERRVATGTLARSISVTNPPLRADNQIIGTVFADAQKAPYAPFVEYDTRPHVAPFKPFVDWAVSKGNREFDVPVRRGSKRHMDLARAGWLAVKKRGTKGIHFMRRAYEAKNEEAKELIIRYVREALARYAR